MRMTKRFACIVLILLVTLFPIKSSASENKDTGIKQNESVSDLSIRFVDSKLTAVWDYDGKVIITVTDPDTFTKLVNKEQVNTNEFSMSIPDGVSEIQFSIVPSANVKEKNAEITYTKKVVREVGAAVTFIETPVINKDSILLPITVFDDEIQVIVICGEPEKALKHEDFSTVTEIVNEIMAKGSYELEIPILSIENKITVSFIDKDGNENTYSYKYTKDVQAPFIDGEKLSLNNSGSYLNYETDKDTLLIDGVVKDYITTDVLGNVTGLTINGYDVPFDSAGRFSFEEKLNLGTNDITICAYDESGNESSLSFTVTMNELKKNPSLLYLLITITVIFLLVVLCLFVKRRAKTRLNDRSESLVKKIIKVKKKEETKMNNDKNDVEKLLSSPMFEGLFVDDNETELELEDKDNAKEYNQPAGEKVKLNISNPKDKTTTPILQKIDEEEAKAENSLISRIKLGIEDRKIQKEEAKKNAELKKEVIKAVEAKKPTETAINISKVIPFSEPVEEEYEDDKEESVKELTKSLSTYAPKNDDVQKQKPLKKETKTEEKKSEEEKEIDSYIKKRNIGSLLSLLVSVIAIFITFTMLIRNTIVVSGSMEPTLKVGSFVLYNQLAYVTKEPERGDIINFYDKDFGEYLSKRVIGIPGDEIKFMDGYVIINGVRADESAYLDPEIETECDKTFLVPKDSVFVLGDNREISYDSRFWDNPYVSYDDITGKYLASFGKIKK